MSLPSHVPRAPILQDVGSRLQWDTNSPRKPCALAGSSHWVAPAKNVAGILVSARPFLSFAGNEGVYRGTPFILSVEVVPLGADSREFQDVSFDRLSHSTGATPTIGIIFEAIPGWQPGLRHRPSRVFGDHCIFLVRMAHGRFQRGLPVVFCRAIGHLRGNSQNVRRSECGKAAVSKCVPVTTH